MEKLLICGAGGHAKVVIETVKENNDYEIVGLTEIDDTNVGKFICGVEIIGGQKDIYKYFREGVTRAFIAVGNVKSYKIRESLYIDLKGIGFSLVNIFNKNSIISPSAELGEGNFVGAGAIINACARIGDNCMINTGAIVEHDCVIGTNVHIASRATALGSVVIGDNCLIGAGATIKQGVVIGKNSIVGAGAVVLKDVESGTAVAGVPAKKIY